MPTVTQSLEIPATLEQVWAVAGDLSRYGEWNETHTGFPDGPPSSEPGATFREQITIMGMPGEASWTVTEASPPTRMAWDGDGPMGIKLGTMLQLAASAGGGKSASITAGGAASAADDSVSIAAGDPASTTVTIEIRFEGGPLTGPIADAVSKSAQKGALESLERLRDLVG